MSGARRREGRQAGEREEATAAQAAGTRWSRLVLGAGHTSLSLLRFCSSGCIDMRAAHTVNRPTDWVLVGFHRSAGLGAPCSATSLVFSPAFIATRAESERGAASSESERGAALHGRYLKSEVQVSRAARRGACGTNVSTRFWLKVGYYEFVFIGICPAVPGQGTSTVYEALALSTLRKDGRTERSI